MKIKKVIYFSISILMALMVINEYEINTEKNNLNSLGNDLCYLISSQMGVDEKVISYLQTHDKDVRITYNSMQILSKGEIFYFELQKKTTNLLKNEEIVVYKNVILGAYSII
ncbi:MAG: hypothetical protein ACI4U5_00915 [Bacilli bacterium]